MFNIKTLLSVFNEKGTLLKWLQKVEEALKNDTLNGVTISQPTDTTAVLTFNFKDGTSLESEVINLPLGPTGPEGKTGATGPAGPTGSQITAITAEPPIISGDYSQTRITVNMSDPDDTKFFTISAKNGENGKGVMAFASGNPTVDSNQPDYTVTPVTAVFTDGTSPNSFKVYAKNGKAGNKINLYCVMLDGAYENYKLACCFYTKAAYEITSQELIPGTIISEIPLTGSIILDDESYNCYYITKSNSINNGFTIVAINNNHSLIINLDSSVDIIKYNKIGEF